MKFLLYFITSITISLNSFSQKNQSQLNRVLTSPQTTLNPIVSPFFRPGIFENFFIQDPQTGEAVCHLCQEVSQIKNNTLTVTLKKNINFHDNHPLTSQDIIFSYQLIQNPKVDAPYWKSKTQKISAIQALSPHKLIITFKTTSPNNIYQLKFPILPRHRFPYFPQSPQKFNSDLQFETSIIGSGPYQFHKWSKNKYLEFRRFPNWWGIQNGYQKLYYFSTIRYKFIFNPLTKISTFKKGQLDLINLSANEFQNLSRIKNNKFIVEKIKTPIPQALTFIGWNLKHPILQSYPIRFALSLLIPTDKKLRPFTTALTPTPWGLQSIYKCKNSCPDLSPNAKKAQEILKQEGWTDSNYDGVLDKITSPKGRISFKFSIYAPDNFHPEWLEAYQQVLKKQGIVMNIKTVEWNTLEKWLRQKQFAAVFLARAIPFPLTPITQWHKKGLLNHWSLNSKEINQITKNIDRQPGKKELYPLLHKKLLNILPITWLWINDTCLIGRKTELKGLQKPKNNRCLYWPQWYK